MYMVSVYGSKYLDTQGTRLIWSCLISIFRVKRTILSNCVLLFCVFWRSGLKNRQPQNLQLFGKMPYGGGPSVLRRFLILLPSLNVLLLISWPCGSYCQHLRLVCSAHIRACALLCDSNHLSLYKLDHTSPATPTKINSFCWKSAFP